MPKFKYQFRSMRSLAERYGVCIKTMRRYLKEAMKARYKIRKAKFGQAMRYCEEDVDKAFEKMGIIESEE